MEINFIEIKQNDNVCFVIGTNNLIKNVLETKTCNVYVSNNTKTSLYISLANGDTYISCNVRTPQDMEQGLLFLTKNFSNRVLGKMEPVQYFKLTKKQGFKELKEHIKNLLHYFFDEYNIDKIDVTILTEINFLIK